MYESSVITTFHWARTGLPQVDRWASGLQLCRFQSKTEAASWGLHPAAGGGKYFLCHYSNAFPRGTPSHFLLDWKTETVSGRCCRNENITTGTNHIPTYRSIKSTVYVAWCYTHKQRQCFLEMCNIFFCTASQGWENVTEPGNAMGLWYVHSSSCWNSSWGTSHPTGKNGVNHDLVYRGQTCLIQLTCSMTATAWVWLSDRAGQVGTGIPARADILSRMVPVNRALQSTELF